jgi:hypothetical protein
LKIKCRKCSCDLKTCKCDKEKETELGINVTKILEEEKLQILKNTIFMKELEKIRDKVKRTGRKRILKEISNDEEKELE